MAHTITNGTGVAGGPMALLARARNSLAAYRTYRRTLSELEVLSDRELRDLGLSRLSIRDIARESAYGK